MRHAPNIHQPTRFLLHPKRTRNSEISRDGYMLDTTWTNHEPNVNYII